MIRAESLDFERYSKMSAQTISEPVCHDSKHYQSSVPFLDWGRLSSTSATTKADPGWCQLNRQALRLRHSELCFIRLLSSVEIISIVL